MKLITTVLGLVLLLCNLSKAQTNTPPDSLYIVTYSLGKAWDNSKKPNEQLYFKEHSANLSSWRKSGLIKLGGRYADKGVIIIASQSLKNARDFIAADIAVAKELFTADVQKLNLFYDGCVERIK